MIVSYNPQLVLLDLSLPFYNGYLDYSCRRCDGLSVALYSGAVHGESTYRNGLLGSDFIAFQQRSDAKQQFFVTDHWVEMGWDLPW